MHCTAANGGTRTSTELPGEASANSCRVYRTAVAVTDWATGSADRAAASITRSEATPS